MQNKKLRIAIAAFGVCVVAISTPSFAERIPCPGNEVPGCKDMNKRNADSLMLSRLHDELKLIPRQEQAWRRLQASHPFPKDEINAEQVDMTKLTAPERAEIMLKAQNQHRETMVKHVAALKNFYAQLMPEQQKIFDERTMMGISEFECKVREPGISQ